MISLNCISSFFRDLWALLTWCLAWRTWYPIMSWGWDKLSSWTQHMRKSVHIPAVTMETLILTSPWIILTDSLWNWIPHLNLFKETKVPRVPALPQVQCDHTATLYWSFFVFLHHSQCSFISFCSIKHIDQVQLRTTGFVQRCDTENTKTIVTPMKQIHSVDFQHLRLSFWDRFIGFNPQLFWDYCPDQCHTLHMFSYRQKEAHGVGTQQGGGTGVSSPPEKTRHKIGFPV